MNFIDWFSSWAYHNDDDDADHHDDDDDHHQVELYLGEHAWVGGRSCRVAGRAATNVCAQFQVPVCVCVFVCVCVCAQFQVDILSLSVSVSVSVLNSRSLFLCVSLSVSVLNSRSMSVLNFRGEIFFVFVFVSLCLSVWRIGWQVEVQESSDFERLSCVARMPAVDRWTIIIIIILTSSS